jgi:hypothetical protein
VVARSARTRPRAPLWVSRLEVPSGIHVEGRLELWNADSPPGAPGPFAPYAKLAMPVIDTLVPAGEEQLHFGTDLGGQRSRANVAIYNAGNVPAAATISMHLVSCPTPLAATEVSVPPNEVVQVSLRPECCDTTCSLEWVRFVRVTVDQPGFSFVSVLSNEFLPDATAAVVAGTR